MKTLLAVIFNLLLLPRVSSAGCEPLRSAADVLACALVSHPDIRITAASIDQAQAGIYAASQRPNPELDGKSVWGKAGDERYRAMELNLAHTIELGDKRGTRRTMAAVIVQARGAEFLQVQERVFLDTWLALVRLRQLRDESAFLNETLEAYTRIIKRLRERPRLTPEQEVSLGLFEITENDNRLKRTALEGERRVLLREVERAVGRPLPAHAELLPARRNTWPTLPFSSEAVSGSEVRAAEADVAAAGADARAAGSQAWPDLKLGPTLENQRQGGQKLNAFGGNLSLTLPLYHRNAGGRAAAELGLRRAEIAREAVTLEARNRRDILIARYHDAVAAIQNSLSPESVAERDTRMDRLYDQGLIAAPLVLETHRERLDWTKSQHEEELVALAALGRVRALEGRLFEEVP